MLWYGESPLPSHRLQDLAAQEGGLLDQAGDALGEVFTQRNGVHDRHLAHLVGGVTGQRP